MLGPNILQYLTARLWNSCLGNLSEQGGAGGTYLLKAAISKALPPAFPCLCYDQWVLALFLCKVIHSGGPKHWLLTLITNSSEDHSWMSALSWKVIRYLLRDANKMLPKQIKSTAYRRKGRSQWKGMHCMQSLWQLYPSSQGPFQHINEPFRIFKYNWIFMPKIHISKNSAMTDTINGLHSKITPAWLASLSLKLKGGALGPRLPASPPLCINHGSCKWSLCSKGNT